MDINELKLQIVCDEEIGGNQNENDASSTSEAVSD